LPFSLFIFCIYVAVLHSIFEYNVVEINIRTVRLKFLRLNLCLMGTEKVYLCAGCVLTESSQHAVVDDGSTKPKSVCREIRHWRRKSLTWYIICL